MNKPFDPTKPVQTRDGRPVRILSTQSKFVFMGVSQPIIAEGLDKHGNVSLSNCGIDGRVYPGFESSCDLINIPEKKKLTGHVNINMSGAISVWSTRDMADFNKSLGRIACLDLSKYNIEYEEGEGL